MKDRHLHRGAALLVSALFSVACGTSESDAPASGGAAGSGGMSGGGAGGASGGGGMGGNAGTSGSGGAAAGYSAKYVADPAGLHQGKSHFQLELTTKADGKPAPGLATSLLLEPLMKMAMMSHGGPVPSDAVTESATPGTYDCTLFFPMASVDASGQPQGEWSLGVTVGAEPAGKLPLTVTPPSGTDTTHVTLKNAADTISAMGAQKLRSWFLFRDTLEASGSGHELELFLATTQEGLMVWPPVTVGLTLVDSSGKEQLTVQSLAVQASTDGSTWSPMTCDATARCKGNLTGLSAGSSGTVYVKLAVNGGEYTTDGSAPDAGKKNGFGTFTVTAP